MLVIRIIVNGSRQTREKTSIQPSSRHATGLLTIVPLAHLLLSRSVPEVHLSLRERLFDDHPFDTDEVWTENRSSDHSEI